MRPDAKSRLVKKASKLPTDDLYRIAALKRCGHLERFFGNAKKEDAKTVEPLSEEDKKLAIERLKNLLGEDANPALVGAAGPPAEAAEPELMSICTIPTYVKGAAAIWKHYQHGKRKHCASDYFPQ